MGSSEEPHHPSIKTKGGHIDSGHCSSAAALTQTIQTTQTTGWKTKKKIPAILRLDQVGSTGCGQS